MTGVGRGSADMWSMVITERDKVDSSKIEN